jgi:hypothetical protein
MRLVTMNAILLRMVGQVRRQILKVEADCIGDYGNIRNS